MAVLRPHRGQVPQRLTRSRAARVPLAALLACGAAIALVAGCNIVGPIAYIVEGPPTKPAVFELPDRPTVVFVDDRRNVVPRTNLRTVIGDTASSSLMTQKLVTRTISARDAINLARVQETGRKPMPIDAIGEAVGAEVVIYVNMVYFAMSDDGMPKPTAAAEVRVIDAVNDVRLFPTDTDDGYMVQAQLSPVSTDLLRSTSSVRLLEDQLATKLGEEIAKLFYEHEPKPLGERTG